MAHIFDGHDVTDLEVLRTEAQEPTFIIVDLAHRGCPECSLAVSSATTTARVTGSIGSTYSEGEHYATVRRPEHVAAYVAQRTQAEDEARDLAAFDASREMRRPAPAAQDLLSFVRATALAGQAIPGPDVVKGLQRWAVEQGLDHHFRIALGDFVRSILNHDRASLDKATALPVRPIAEYDVHDFERSEFDALNCALCGCTAGATHHV
jgi:hypothetical protein